MNGVKMSFPGCAASVHCSDCARGVTSVLSSRFVISEHLQHSCTEIFSVAPKMDLHENFLNCSSSFSHWQHLILERENHLKVLYPKTQ